MIYTVQPGESLNGIAIKFLGSAGPAATLFQINKSRIKSGSPALLAAGEQLVIPDQMITAAKAGRKAARDPNEVVLEVNGLEYGGWENVQVGWSLETASGSFSVQVTDKWQPGQEPWPIFKNDEVRVYIGGDLLINGYVDRVGFTLDASSHSMTVSGRDRTCDLIDCSAMNRPGVFKKKKLEEIAQILSRPFGVNVVADVDTGAVIPVFSIQPGEKVHEAIARAAVAKNLIVTSAFGGSLALTRSGSRRATDAIVEGKNLKGGDSEASAVDRFSEYIVEGQSDGQGKAKNAMRATYRDAEVPRYRPLMLHAEQKATAEHLKARAEWECRSRAAKGSGGTLTVVGWRQSDGKLWDTNRIVNVYAPTLGLSEDMLVTEVIYEQSSGGQTVNMRVVRPDAYASEDELHAEKEVLRADRVKRKGKGKNRKVSQAEIDAELRQLGNPR